MNVNLREAVYAVFGFWMFVALALVIVTVFPETTSVPGQFGTACR